MRHGQILETGSPTELLVRHNQQVNSEFQYYRNGKQDSF